MVTRPEFYGTLGLFVAALIWFVKHYARTWLSGIIHAEIGRVYSLSQESARDKVNALKEVDEILRQLKSIQENLYAKAVNLCFWGDLYPDISREDLLKRLMETLIENEIKNYPGASREALASEASLEKMLNAACGALSWSSFQAFSQANTKVGSSSIWLPDTLAGLVDSVLQLYSKGLPHGFWIKAIRDVWFGKAKSGTLLPEIAKAQTEWGKSRDDLETRIRRELRQLLGVETPHMPLTF